MRSGKTGLSAIPQRREKDPANPTIRVLVEGDVPGAAALLARAYPGHGWNTREECEAYFRQVLFENPWRDLELPSWVAEENGRIIAFQLVMARPMQFEERLIRAAVSCQFLVDPDWRNALTALQLLQACLSGPQDLTLADGANDQARRIWAGLGGTASLLYSLQWIRPLRPARHALSLLAGRLPFGIPLTIPARPIAALGDLVAARLRPNRFLLDETALVEDALDPPTMLTHLREMTKGCALQPVYGTRSLDWLLHQSSLKKRHGALRARAVLDAGRQPIGWYIYYLQPGGVSEVLQVCARTGCFPSVLERLLADAWRQGAAAVRGRLDPRYAQELSDRHSWFRREGTWTLVHSRHADLLAAIHRGEAFLSRLEGEWWLRFVGG